MSLAEAFGEPLWCVGTGFRNTHLRAIAPTVSNSKLSGNVSPGIEPWAANVFTEQSAKGTFIRKNPTLLKLLRKLKINTNETWDKILADGGSVQGLSELDGVVVPRQYGRLVEAERVLHVGSACEQLGHAVDEFPQTLESALRKEVMHLYENAAELILHGLNLHRNEIYATDSISTTVSKSRTPIDLDIASV